MNDYEFIFYILVFILYMTSFVVLGLYKNSEIIGLGLLLATHIISSIAISGSISSNVSKTPISTITLMKELCSYFTSTKTTCDAFMFSSVYAAAFIMISQLVSLFFVIIAILKLHILFGETGSEIVMPAVSRSMLSTYEELFFINVFISYSFLAIYFLGNKSIVTLTPKYTNTIISLVNGMFFVGLFTSIYSIYEGYAFYDLGERTLIL